MQRGLLLTVLAIVMWGAAAAQELNVKLEDARMVGIRDNTPFELKIAKLEAKANPRRRANKIANMTGNGFTARAQNRGNPVEVEAGRIEGTPAKMQFPAGLRVATPQMSIQCASGVWKEPELNCADGAEVAGAWWRFTAPTLRVNMDTEALYFYGGVAGVWERF